MSHYKNLEQLKNNPDYEYIQPPVGHFSSAKFDIFEVIARSIMSLWTVGPEPWFKSQAKCFFSMKLGGVSVYKKNSLLE